MLTYFLNKYICGIVSLFLFSIRPININVKRITLKYSPVQNYSIIWSSVTDLNYDC